MRRLDITREFQQFLLNLESNSNDTQSNTQFNKHGCSSYKSQIHNSINFINKFKKYVHLSNIFVFICDNFDFHKVNFVNYINPTLCLTIMIIDIGILCSTKIH